MIASEDIQIAEEWIRKNCPRAHIRATLAKGLAFVQAMDRAGLAVETIDAAELQGFLAETNNTPAFRKYFLQPQL